MKKNFCAILLLILTHGWLGAQQNRYRGIPNRVEVVNPYWNSYKEEYKVRDDTAMRKSLELGVSSYSLVEYCLGIDYLLEHLENSAEAQDSWLEYMDSLKSFSQGKFARSGIVPLESQFFLATLRRNEDELKKLYPNAYPFLIKNTPPMYEYAYRAADYESILLKMGFSEVKGEGIMYDLLLLEDTSLLKVIEGNQWLKDRYIAWLTNEVPDESFYFEVSDARAALILMRKILYPWNIFRQDRSPLSQLTAEQLEKIMVVQTHPIPQNSPVRVLNGIWQGRFGDTKEIFFLNGYSDVDNSANRVTGKSKFVGQPDSKYVPMDGSYKDKGDYFLLEMVEQPDTAEWNGVFKYQVDKKTRIIKGTWQSNNGMLVREFELKKINEDKWW